MANKNSAVVADFPWWGWLIISCIVGFVGGVFLGKASSYAGALGVYYYTYINKWLTCFCLGVLCISVSVTLGVFMLKALITEAHVKAMEIFYGKEREVKSVVVKTKRDSVKKVKNNADKAFLTDYDD